MMCLLVCLTVSYVRGLVPDNCHGLGRDSRDSYANIIGLSSELLPLRIQLDKHFEEPRERMKVRSTSAHVLVSSSPSLGNTVN